MVKKIFFKQLLVAICTLFLVFLICSAIVGWYFVKKFTARPVYSARRLAEHDENRALLLKEFGAQRVQFSAQDGTQLIGYFINRPTAKCVILACHGYRMCKERMCAIVKMFPNDCLFLFDHRAHGESQGEYTTLGYLEKQDVIAANKFLQTQDKTKQLPIIGLGVSMGAVSLLAAAATEQQPFKAIILDSPFLRLDRQARKLLHKRYGVPEISTRFIGERLFNFIMKFSLKEVNAHAWAQKIKIPVLVIHSRCDDTVSIKDALKLYDAFSTTKEFWQVDGSGHARIFNDCFEEYSSKIHNFIAFV
jgi:alpha-beta hydrolase superfamily lysophospholipase